MKEPRLSQVVLWLSKPQIISAVTAALEELPKEEELKAKASSSKQDGYDGLWRAMRGCDRLDAFRLYWTGWDFNLGSSGAT